MRKTRIICTLGPATESPEMLRKLLNAGADVFRLNMSHAKHDWCREICKRIREASEDVGKAVGILFDLQGPSIRTGDVKGKITLEPGDLVEFRNRGTEARLEKSTTVNYPGLMSDVKEGNQLTVDNGELLMKIQQIKEDRLVCEVITAGAMGSRRHINLPGVRLKLPALTEKDHSDIKVAAECQADFLAGSFVRDSDHVRQLRAAIQAEGCEAAIISKLEDQEAIRQLDHIIRESDVIMVARGDLGIEVHVEELPIIQRRIVKRCHQLGRRVIVATHMLESMTENPTPTRAEVTDVSNAVYEEADAIMLSGETTVGRHPIRCVELMDRVARRIERSGGLGYGKEAVLETERQKIIQAACGLADSIPRSLLVVFTRSGQTAHHTALLRPRTPIFAFTPESSLCSRFTLSRGVRSFKVVFEEDPKGTIVAAIDFLRHKYRLEKDTPIIVVSEIHREGHSVDCILVEHS